MKGEVILINYQKGFIAIQTDYGVSVVELLGSYDVEIGDIISGNLDDCGGEDLFNITQDEEMDTYIQATGCSQSCIQELMY